MKWDMLILSEHIPSPNVSIEVQNVLSIMLSSDFAKITFIIV